MGLSIKDARIIASLLPHSSYKSYNILIPMKQTNALIKECMFTFGGAKLLFKDNNDIN